MGYVYVLLAGSCTALSNLFVRRSTDWNSSSQGDPFITYRLAGSALFILLISVGSHATLAIDSPTAFIGLLAGLALGSLMWFIGKSVDTGPAALTFAIISSSSVVPPLIMATLFGEPFGHAYTWHHGLGALMVATGLFWMASKNPNNMANRKWLTYAIGGFIAHSLLLSLFQWRALMCQPAAPASIFLPFQCNPQASEGLPLTMFATATLMQAFGARGNGLQVTKSLWPLLAFGIAGGVINGLGNLCLVKGTHCAATSTEKAVLFPLYCVWLIFCCNLWGKYLYRESIHWPGSILCFLGILVSLT